MFCQCKSNAWMEPFIYGFKLTIEIVDSWTAAPADALATHLFLGLIQGAGLDL